MARKPIDIGTVGNDGTGDSIRDSFRKVNDNFRELYSALGLSGELQFTGLEDTPDAYTGQENAVVTVNSTANGLQFRQLQPGTGISIDTDTNENAIILNNLFADIAGDPAPNIGGPLNAQNGIERFPIGNLVNIADYNELLEAKNKMQTVHGPSAASTDRFVSNKGYTDTKISIAGTDSIDPASGQPNPSWGEMSGPLILSRDPTPLDDTVWEGKIAATKRYVDTSGFSSIANLYVATSGSDEQPNRSKEQYGRSLASAYRTLEAALKRAEEIVLEAPIDVGPYKKVLTYNNGANQCTLTAIGTATGSGLGFTSQLFMSVDTIRVSNNGSLYLPGDIVTVSGGTYSQPAQFEVLAVNVTPGTNGRGPIRTIRLITSGVYTVLPGSTDVSTTVSSGSFGVGALVSITYKVNNIAVVSGGSGYGLVSVRITGGNGSGAFGRANVVNGAITGITVTHKGSGFTSIPTVIVNLPRFFIETENNRTDFTGDVLSGTPTAIRTRDIREGLLLKGETSGAIAQILSHSGELSTGVGTTGSEIFDVDLLSGEFQIGEVISYGDITRNVQISVLVESGVYEENYPLKIPQNVAIIGDEFRRTIIKPKTATTNAPMSGMSSSPWASTLFRRDPVIDEMTVVERAFGYHYLSDPTQPVYPLLNNSGYKRSAAELLTINREFIKSQVVGWINYNITNNISPFSSSFVYNQDRCRRDVGFIVDAITFDLTYGGYSRTISAALKYFSNVSATIAIEEQLSQTVASILQINEIAQSVIINSEITSVYSDSGELIDLSDPDVINTNEFTQTIDQAFVAEPDADTTTSALIDIIVDIISNSGAANYPKDNNQMDVFLCNDATIIRAVTCQGHGGFMMVLDPSGQIQTKSPYCQESASFTKSTGRKTFAGGLLVDGFTGNQQFRIVSAPSTTLINVSGFLRVPMTPCSFIVNDVIYRVNYVRNYNNGITSPTYSTAQLILDETTPYSGSVGAQECTFNTLSNSNLVLTDLENNLQPGATVRFTTTDTLPSGLFANTDYYVLSSGFTEFSFSVSAQYGSTTPVVIADTGAGTHTVERVFEILMPGNRSMLTNDYTQINDLGYGLIVANGGLAEAVSMFTYYCQISYYALTGGQIRSLGGSSSHGNYGLVAEGSDPLEVPTPVTLYHDISQIVTVISDTATRKNIKGSVVIYAVYSDYLPIQGSELEVNHGNTIYRYEIASVDAVIDLVYENLCKITISTSEGLIAGISNGQRATVRQNSFVVLTGDIVDVTTRPSTALRLNESNTVYRILNFENYNSTFDKDVFTISSINLTSGIITTDKPHRQQVGYQVKIVKNAGDTLPSAIVPKTDVAVGTIYYVVNVSAENELKLSLSKGGPVIDLSAGPSYSGSLASTVEPYGLGLTQLRENYSHININVYPTQPVSNPSSLQSCTVTVGDPAVINRNLHGFSAGTALRFFGTLPLGFGSGHYWVLSLSNSSNSFKISDTPPISSTQIGVGGILTTGASTVITNLTSTTGLEVGMGLVAVSNKTISSISGNGTTATVTFVGNGKLPYLIGQIVSISGSGNVGFNNSSAEITSVTTNTISYLNSTNATASGGTIAVTATGSLGTTPTIVSIDSQTSITISSSGASNGSVVFNVEGIPTAALTTGSDVTIGTVVSTGTTIAVTSVSALEQSRIINSEFVHEGTLHTITDYELNPNDADYSVITVTPAIVTSVIDYSAPLVLKSAVPAGTINASGTLTIRIALVRATGHDFLEVGSGGYADTNYPREIFGPSVTDFSSTPTWATSYDTSGGVVSRAQVQERDVGRAFFVTTDQYGNFSVGPYFKVDQGTGRVTFNASIALSQVDGIGFKRGVTVNEFSVDDSLTDGANDAVPTEAAVRGYIDRRLGVSHTGSSVISDNLIPDINGGFMPLSGQLAMKANMSLGNNRIENLGVPVNDTDAARLDSINILNIKDTDGDPLFTFTQVQAGQLLVLTGDKNTISNVTPYGDIAFTLNTGDSSLNGINAEINDNVITNININSSAGIDQSKLSMVAASTRANAIGITQADRGLASFDSAQFTATSGWLTIKDNGLALSKLVTLGAKQVIGNPSPTTSASPSAVSYSDVVSDGGAIKKAQFASVGYVKRVNGVPGAYTDDAHYAIVNDDTAKSSSTLVRRDVNGDFASRYITADELKVTTSLTSFTVLRSNELSTSSGAVELSGYGGAGGSGFVGVSIGAGSLAANNKSTYNNTTHEFRNQAGTTTFAVLDTTGLNLNTRTLTTTSITTGSSTTAGTITGQWILADTPGGSSRTNSRLQATYAADLAEYYEGDAEYEVGTVLVFGGEKEVTISNRYGDSRVAGVVSDNAAYSMYGACPGFKNQIALQGRVPCKVIGNIKKGDILVTSSMPGVAVVASVTVSAGTMIGKALQDYNSTKVGIIEVAVGRT